MNSLCFLRVRLRTNRKLNFQQKSAFSPIFPKWHSISITQNTPQRGGQHTSHLLQRVNWNQFNLRRGVSFGPYAGKLVNNEIKCTEVKVIGGETKKPELMELKEALRFARTNNLDLVQVDPTQEPPICKLMSFEEEQKKHHKKGTIKRETLQEEKEVRFSWTTEKNDIQLKILRMKRFLKEGKRVRCSLMQKKHHRDWSEEFFNEVRHYFDQLYSLMSDVAIIDQRSQLIVKRGHFACTFLPNQTNKKISKFPDGYYTPQATVELLEKVAEDLIRKNKRNIEIGRLSKPPVKFVNRHLDEMNELMMQNSDLKINAKLTDLDRPPLTKKDYERLNRKTREKILNEE